MEEMMMDEREKYYKILEALDYDLLSKCINVKPKEMLNLVLYYAAKRNAPQETLCRLNFLYEVVFYLDGIYNYSGIRRWFLRKRKQLKGKAPIDILTGDWKPEDKYPQMVLNLAKQLLCGQIAT